VSASGEDTFMLHGVQLWTSLPRALKLMEPAYQNLPSSSIPVVEGDGVKVRVIGGEFEAVQSPAKTLMPLFAWHVTVQPGKEFTTPVPEFFEAGVYVLAGEGTCGSDRTQIRIGQLALFTQGDRIGVANTSDAPLDVLLLGGAPAEGPLVFHGPFVMNTVEQIRYAERAYMTGRMGSLAQN